MNVWFLKGGLYAIYFISYCKYLLVARPKPKARWARPGGRCPGPLNVNWTALDTGLCEQLMEKSYLPAGRFILVDGESWSLQYFCLLCLSRALLQPRLVQETRANLFGAILWKGEAGVVVTQRIPFPRQGVLVGFESSFPMAAVSSATVAPRSVGPRAWEALPLGPSG